LWKQRALLTLVNYETLVRDSALIESLALQFDIVVLDEAQRIKNTSGATSQAVRQLPRQRSWALTGTPIENSADDLVGLFEFVNPGTLHPGMKPREMGRAIQDTVIRRTKDQVLDDLPPKLVFDPRIDLTTAQWESYQRAEHDGVLRLNEMGDELALQHVFELVLRLKQICNFDPATGDSAKLDHLRAELAECAASGRKAIVFSQWVDTLDRIAQGLGHLGHVAYHGRVPHAQRDGVIEKFRNDPNTQVILMSYGAGSVGLNLQFAEYVFLFDRWWNPAVEDQAINRAHRIGAAGPVTVLRYLAAGTIEERIDQILQQKRELFASVFDDTQAATTGGLSRDQLLSLFNLRTPEGRLAA
jgi:SNF2 family DNA or RNA helicase